MPFTGSIKTHQLTTDDTYPSWLSFVINTSTINGLLTYDSDSKLVWTKDNTQIVKIKSFMNATTNPDRLSELDFSTDLPTLFKSYERVFANVHTSIKDITKSLEKKSRFSKEVNPQKLLAAIHKELLSLGSNLEQNKIIEIFRDIVLNALGPDAPGGPNPFWLDCYAKLTENPTCTSRVEIELLIVTYWKNRVGNCYVNLLTDREPEFPSMGKLLVGAVLERTCVNCSKESNGRLRLAKLMTLETASMVTMLETNCFLVKVIAIKTEFNSAYVFFPLILSKHSSLMAVGEPNNLPTQCIMILELLNQQSNPNQMISKPCKRKLD